MAAVLLLAGCGATAQVATTPPSSTQRSAIPGSSTVVLTLADALARAKANSPQFQAALTQLGLAREDRVQARAALLPNVNYTNSFIYTQGNGTPSGRYIANNGVHEYIGQGVANEALGIRNVSRTISGPKPPKRSPRRGRKSPLGDS